MLIPNLSPFNTTLSKIKEVPDTFFSNVEKAGKFDKTLFPKWLTNADGTQAVFEKGTELRAKFKAIYDKYKAIKSEKERKKIVDAYFETNKILQLCNYDNQVNYFELDDINENVRAEVEQAFLYLYNAALKHPGFEAHAKDSLKKALKNFTDNNGLEICPFCGLEMMLQIDGQPRLPLDHWLNKDRFPFSAVNFENLIPIGKDCNANGVKGAKNVLKDKDLRRVRAFYPYAVNRGTAISISCTRAPDIDNVLGEWTFHIKENEATEKYAFDSWDYIFNISTRYSSYFVDNIIPNWKKRYIEFIKNEEDDIHVSHAQNVEEFKDNLRAWKRTFNVKRVPASILYKKFIDYLLEASDEFLFGLVESFKSQVEAGVI